MLKNGVEEKLVYLKTLWRKNREGDKKYENIYSNYAFFMYD